MFTFSFRRHCSATDVTSLVISAVDMTKLRLTPLLWCAFPLWVYIQSIPVQRHPQMSRTGVSPMQGLQNETSYSATLSRQQRRLSQPNLSFQWPLVREWGGMATTHSKWHQLQCRRTTVTLTLPFHQFNPQRLLRKPHKSLYLLVHRRQQGWQHNGQESRTSHVNRGIHFWPFHFLTTAEVPGICFPQSSPVAHIVFIILDFLTLHAAFFSMWSAVDKLL